MTDEKRYNQIVANQIERLKDSCAHSVGVVGYEGYDEFFAGYNNNWVKACFDLFGRELNDNEASFISSLNGRSSKVAVKLDEFNKLDLMAIASILQIVLSPLGRVVIVSSQKGVAIKQIGHFLSLYFISMTKRVPKIAKYFEFNPATSVFREKTARNRWCISFKECKSGREERLTGEHSIELLTLFDCENINDASGLLTVMGAEASSENFKVALLMSDHLVVEPDYFLEVANQWNSRK